jgi:hypothetical protein
MPAKQKNFNTVADGLERALGEGAPGREQDWIGGADRALAAVEEAVRRRVEALRTPDGQLVDVDRPRLPSPAVDRRTDGLERELRQVLERAQTLRGQVRGAAEGIGLEQPPEEAAGALSVAPEAGAVAALGVFRQQARALAEALRRLEQQEADLVLDSITPDIGAGD